MKNKYTIGKVIGNLTITHKEGKKYYVTCSCGTELVFGSREMKTKTKDLKAKGFAGCGVCSRKYYAENRSDVEKYRYIYNAYKTAALKRNLEFNLSREEFTSMITSECFYCGKLNSNSRKDRLSNELLTYNGVDRLDSNLGYHCDNTVACCSTCNYMKGTLTAPEFIEQAKLIYSRNVQRLSRKGVGSSGPKQETPSVARMDDDIVYSTK
jgi:hypothetical protein